MSLAIHSNWPNLNKVWGWYSNPTNFIFKTAKLAIAIFSTPFAIVLDIIGRVFSICSPSSDPVIPQAPEENNASSTEDAEPVVEKPFYKTKTCYGISAVAAAAGAVGVGLLTGILEIAPMAVV